MKARSCISKPVVSQAMAAGRTGSQDHFNGTSADVKEELVQKITIIIPLSVLNSGLITELATLTKEHPGNTELYFKVTDDTDSRMSVDLISRPVKLSVGRDLITYLKERPELGFRIN